MTALRYYNSIENGFSFCYSGDAMDRLVISPIDDAFLKAIFSYWFLTAKQVTRLLYSEGSLTSVSSRLKRLSDNGYLHRTYCPTEFGRAPIVYTLDRKGINYLKATGDLEDVRYRPSEVPNTHIFMSHTLAVNDILIDLALTTKKCQNLEVRQIMHERDLKRMPLVIELSDRTIRVVPDAWIELRVNGNEQMCLWLELDRGTTDQKKWRRKIEAITASMKGVYQEHFKVNNLTVMVVTTSGAKRLSDLVEWTESELSNNGQKKLAQLFYFSEYSRGLYTDICFRRPFDAHLYPLLEGSDGTG